MQGFDKEDNIMRKARRMDGIGNKEGNENDIIY